MFFIFFIYLFIFFFFIDEDKTEVVISSSQKNKKGKSLFERWEESLTNCTSFPQIFLHLSSLEKSIIWSKSALHARCRICRRKGDGEHMLLCDGCDRGHHMYCLKPPVKVSTTTHLFFAAWSAGTVKCRLHLCRRVRLTGVLDMTPNYLMVRFQSCSSEECGVPLHWHYYWVHSDLVW